LLGETGSRVGAVGGGQSKDGLASPTHPFFVEVNAADFGFAYHGGFWQLLQGFIRDEALVDQRQSIHEAFKNTLQFSNQVGESVQGPAALEFCAVVQDGFDAKDTFAFGIDLQR
jgi:S-adenosylmethionine synthetase